MADKVATQNMPGMIYKDGVWTGAKRKRPAGYFQLGEIFMSHLKKNPEIIAQIDGTTGKSETYRNIYDKSVRCALWLRKYGIGRDDVVCYCSANNMDSCIPFLASFYIGSIFNPWWNECLDNEITKYFINYTQPKVVFADEKSAAFIMNVLKEMNYDMRIIVFGKMSGLASFTDILNQVSADEFKSFECTKINDAKEPAIILYTSGTTGNPKGALHTFGSIVSFIEILSMKRNISLWFSNLCWLSAVINTIAWVLTQSTAIIYDSPSEEVAYQLISKFRVTYVMMGTAAANRFSKAQELSVYDVSSVTELLFGGSIAHKGTVEFLLTRFNNASIKSAYGSTECLGVHGLRNGEKLASCGRVVPNHEVKVIDVETKQILGPNEQGELCCRGTTLMKYYWENPQATREAIDSDGWYHTGDVGYYDADGDFFIVERMKELIKYRLHHVVPAVIECVIHNIPGVAEVGVVAKPHIEDLEQPTAFIKTIPGVDLTEDDIHKVVEGKLHDRMKLRGGVYFLDEMPRTSSGKISKRELRILAKTQSS